MDQQIFKQQNVQRFLYSFIKFSQDTSNWTDVLRGNDSDDCLGVLFKELGGL